MATLWLVAVSRLSPNNPSLEEGFKNEVQRILRSFASWPDPEVRWIPNASQTTPATDCIVYFVGNYDTGAARQFGQSLGASLSPEQRDLMRSDNFNELGICYRVPENPTVACEVHIGKCMHALRNLRRYRPDFTPTEMADYPVLLAAVAWHEAMHNKVDPQMGRDWDLHTDGGGAWAGTQSFGPAGGFRGAREPSARNRELMSSHFPGAVPQYIFSG